MIYEIVRDEINNRDFEDLLKMGCPTDEYLIEITDIVGEIRRNNIRDEQLLAKVIGDTFNYYFGYNREGKLGYTIDKCLPAARNILLKLKENDYARF